MKTARARDVTCWPRASQASRAAAAGLLGRPQPAAAGGQALILGGNNTTDAAFTQVIRNDDKSAMHLLGTGYAILAGISNISNGYAIKGITENASDSTALFGETNSHYSQIAVDADCRREQGEGIAVRARTKNGIGVYASSPGGYAIQAVGRTVFSRSGKVTFTAGQASRTVTGHAITADSLVVATIQGNVAGTWVRGVSLSDANETFTIRLNRAAPAQLTVGWFIVN